MFLLTYRRQQQQGNLWSVAAADSGRRMGVVSWADQHRRLPAPTPRAGGGVGGGVRTEGGLAKLSRRSQSFHSYDMDRRSPLARQSPGSIGRQLKSSSSQPSGMSGRLQPPAEGGSRLSAIPQPGGSGLRAPRSRPLTPELGVRASSSSSSSSSSSLDVHLGGLGRHPATIMEEDVSGAPSPPPPPLPPPFGGAAREPRGLACGGAQRARKFHGGGGGGDGGDSRLARAVENAKAAGRLEVANFDGDGDVDFSPDGGFAALGFGALAATRLPSGGAQRLPRGGAREGPAPRCGADAATAAAGRRISCQERPSLDGGDTSERSERNDGAPRKTSRSLIARGDGGGAGGGGKRGSCSSGIPKPGACGQGGRRRGPTTGALGDCRVNGGSPLGLPLLKSPGDSKTSSSSSLASLEGRSTGSATPLSPGFLSPTPTGAGGGVTPHFPAGRISMPATPASGGQAVAAATAAAGGVAVATGAGRVLSNGVQLPLAQQQQQHPNTATVAPFSYRLQTERGARSGPARGGGERTRTPASVRKSREQQLVVHSIVGSGEEGGFMCARIVCTGAREMVISGASNNNRMIRRIFRHHRHRRTDRLPSVGRTQDNAAGGAGLSDAACRSGEEFEDNSSSRARGRRREGRRTALASEQPGGVAAERADHRHRHRRHRSLGGASAPGAGAMLGEDPSSWYFADEEEDDEESWRASSVSKARFVRAESESGKAGGGAGGAGARNWRRASATQLTVFSSLTGVIAARPAVQASRRQPEERRRKSFAGSLLPYWSGEEAVAASAGHQRREEREAAAATATAAVGRQQAPPTALPAVAAASVSGALQKSTRSLSRSGSKSEKLSGRASVALGMGGFEDRGPSREQQQQKNQQHQQYHSQQQQHQQHNQHQQQQHNQQQHHGGAGSRPTSRYGDSEGSKSDDEILACKSKRKWKAKRQSSESCAREGIASMDQDVILTMLSDIESMLYYRVYGESVETEWERNVKDINDLKQDLEETMSNLRDTQVPHSSLKAGFGPTGRPPWVDTASEHQGSPRMQAGEAPSLGTGRFPASSTSSLATAGSGGSGGGAAGPGRRPRSGVMVPAEGGGRCYGRGPPRAAGRVGHEARPGACELFSEEDDEVMDEDEEDGEELVIECDDLEVSGYASDGDLLGKSLYRRQRTSGYLTDGGSGFSSHKLSLFQPGPQARSKVPRVTSLTPGEGDSWEDSSSVSSGLSDTIDNISTDDLNTSSSVSSYPTTPTNSRKNLSLQLKTDAEKCSLGEGGSGWYCSLPREGRKKADSRADTRSGTTGRAGGGYGGGGGAGEWGAVGRRSVEAGGGSSQAGGGDGEREKRARRRGLPVAGQYGMGSRATAATGGMTAAGGAAVTTAAAAAGGAVTPAGAASSRMSSRVTQLKTTGKTDDAKASEKRLMSPKPVRIQRAVSDAGRSVLGGDDTRKPPSGLARPIGMTATGIRKPGSGASGAMVTASGATIRSGSATVGKIPTARSGGLGGTLSRGGGGSAAGRKISLESTPVTEQMGLMNARASPQYRSLPRPAKSAYGKSRYTGEMSVGGGGAGGRAAGAAGGTTLKEAAKFTLGGSVTSLTNQTDREKAMLADTECAASREAKLGGRAGFHPGSHQQELSYSGVSSPASRMSFGYKSKGKASAAESAAKASVGQQQQQPKTPALSMRRQLSGGGTVATSSEGRAPDSGNGSPMHAAATDTVSSLRDVPPPSSSSSSATAAAIAARDFDYSPLLLLPPASDFGAPESPPMSPASVKSADSCCHAPAASASPYPKGGPSYTSLGCSRNTSCESLGPPPAAAGFGGGHAEGRPASLRGSPVHYASPTSYGSPTHPAAHGTRDPKAAPLLHPAAATEMGIDGGGGGGVGGGSQGSPSKAVAGKSLLERYGMAYGRSSEEIAEQQRCHSVLGLCDSPDSLSLAPLPSLSSLASRYQLPVSPSLASPPPASPPPSPRLLGPQGSFEQLGREGPAKRLSAASLDGRPKALSRSTSFRDCTEQLHGSVLSLASCTSSIYSVIETLRRELDQSQDKVSTLTGQLSTNANLVAAFEKSLTSMTSRLQNLTASAEQKDSELGELRKMIDNLTKENMAAQEAMSGVLSTTQQSNTGSLSPQAGEPRLHRQNSCESISSVNSITSHSSAELADAKKKKKGWLKISFRQAFSKKKGGKGPGEGEPGKSPETSAQPAATSEADTTTPGQPGTKPSEGPAGPPPPEVDTIMQLRSELRHKEMKLTDIRLEALNSAHQLNTLQDAMNSMQSMIESLKVENDQLKSDTPVVGAATAPGGTAEPTSPRPLRSRLQHSRSLPSTSNLGT
ncbi:unnamed protein product [Lampetra fluviatilis]